MVLIPSRSSGLLVFPQFPEYATVFPEFIKVAFLHDPTVLHHVDVIEMNQQMQSVQGGDQHFIFE